MNPSILSPIKLNGSLRQGGRERLRRLEMEVERMHHRAHISERMLILFASLTASWFLMFDVYPPNDSFGAFAVKGLFWMVVFASTVIFHFGALIADSQRFRIGACLAYSVIWGAWVMLALTTERPSYGTPLLFGLAVMAFYEAMRLKPKTNG